MPAASQTLLDDTIVNIDEWLAEEVRLAFAEQEGTAFVTGDGTQQAEGVPQLHRRRQRLVGVGQCRLHRNRR